MCIRDRHHLFKTRLPAPTSIVDYMRCRCAAHQTLAVKYSLVLPPPSLPQTSRCRCDPPAAPAAKSSLWLCVPGYSYFLFIRQQLASLPKQPSNDAQRRVEEAKIPAFFAEFLRRSLLPYAKPCPDCRQSRETLLQLEPPLPRALLLRVTWSLSFPSGEKALTFYGVPERFDLAAMSPGLKSAPYLLKSVLVRSKAYGEGVIVWNAVMKCYLLYTLRFSVRVDSLADLNAYCSQLQYQPLLLLYDAVE